MDDVSVLFASDAVTRYLFPDFLRARSDIIDAVSIRRVPNTQRRIPEELTSQMSLFHKAKYIR
jgi:hypothetical protein